MLVPGVFAITVVDFLLFSSYTIISSSLVAQTVKGSAYNAEDWVRSLGWEDPLGKEMATHSSTLAWKIPWTEEPGGLTVHGVKRVRHDLATKQQQ